MASSTSSGSPVLRIITTRHTGARSLAWRRSARSLPTRSRRRAATTTTTQPASEHEGREVAEVRDASSRARQQRLDARGELAGAERLGDVVVGAGVEAGLDVGLLGPRGQQDHRQVGEGRVGTDRADRVEAGDARASSRRARPGRAAAPGRRRWRRRRRDTATMSCPSVESLNSTSSRMSTSSSATRILCHDYPLPVLSVKTSGAVAASHARRAAPSRSDPAPVA